MKKITVLTMLISLSAIAGNRPYTIDMTGSKFVTTSANLYDDEILNDFDSYAVKLSGQYQKDFTAMAKSSNPDVRCTFTVVKSSSSGSVLKINEDLEVDSGDTCDLTIRYKNGKEATVSIYSEGT